MFGSDVQAPRDAASIRWAMAVESDSSRTIDESVSTDLAVPTVLSGSEPPHLERIVHGAALTHLARTKVSLYVADPAPSPRFWRSPTCYGALTRGRGRGERSALGLALWKPARRSG